MQLTMKFLSTALVAAFAYSQAASAVDLACEGCNGTQMVAKAIQQGKGNHRVYSLSTNTIIGYSVTCVGDVPVGVPGSPDGTTQTTEDDTSGGELDGVGGCALGRPLQAATVPVSAAATNAWNLTENFYQANNHSVTRVDMSVDAANYTLGLAGGSVYGMLADNQLRTDLFDFVLDQSQGLEGYVAALSAGLLASLNILPNTLLIGVTFGDHTSVLLLYNASTRQLTAVPHTAKLPNGQAAVEANAADFQGKYNMVGVNQTAYENYLNQMGVQTIGVSGTQLACTWNGTKLSCRLQIMTP